ncbi:HD-GYP domain-containing protein [Methylococcus sp. EFPC2]|uniref:HD-GYP domain-containing protein n=1 Tax=Methylococcus sp. EFPC2 TaxID=2812648 RepID=UPI001967E69A|nr:HD domain-containing phosphohydrolase [Methylococcus sp. EFPC2]QSA97545.1 HD domain-containing protein [Methylococcus sp. EFPC2]
MKNSLPNERYYLRHLSEMSREREIQVHEDIRNSNGLALLGKGERINAEKIDRILQHKLLKPIDHSILIADAVNSSVLVQGARRVMDSSSPLSEVLRRVVGAAKLASHLGRLPLEPMVANKLTTMQAQLPDIFEHSLESACLAIALGKLCGASESELDAMAGIGLLHDIGSLHLDTALFETDAHFTPEQWRQMHAHPVIGFLILKYGPRNYRDLTVPVLEHHERMDGSGYPRKLDGADISRLGRIAAVVEVVLGVLQKHPLHHLSVVMKAQDGKLDDSVMQALLRTLRRSGDYGDAAHNGKVGRTELDSLCSVLSLLLAEWNRLVQELEADGTCSCQVLGGQMDKVHLLLRQTGYSDDYQQWLSIIATDAESTSELFSVLHEAFYYVRQAIHSAVRENQATCAARMDQLFHFLDLAEKIFASLDH